MGKLMRVNPTRRRRKRKTGGDGKLLLVAAAIAGGLALLMRGQKKPGVAGLGDLPAFYPWQTGPFPMYETTNKAYRQAQILQSQEVNAAGKVILAPGTIQPVQYYKYLPDFNPKEPKVPGATAKKVVESAAKKGVNGLGGLAAAANAEALPCNPFLFMGLGSSMPPQHWPAEFEAINTAYEVVS
jgi:hypothetical protein